MSGIKIIPGIRKRRGQSRPVMECARFSRGKIAPGMRKRRGQSRAATETVWGGFEALASGRGWSAWLSAGPSGPEV